MTKPLFSDFPEVSSKQWKQKIQVDLKGADYNDTLIWNTNEGIDVKPFYHADDFEHFHNITNASTTWKIGQVIKVTDETEANTKALDAIDRGVEAIRFISVNNQINIDALIKGIDTKAISVHIEAEETLIHTDIAETNVNNDIIGHLAKTGNWYHNLKDDHHNFEELVKKCNQITINSNLYQNSGATIVQQLSYALAHANEYLNHLSSILSDKSKASLKVIFNVSVGTNYFFEIAKLRALRLLWKTLAGEYKFNTNCIIVAEPSKRNKTIYDYNTNMLRTTTECMSAVLGGANEVFNLPYDVLYHNQNEFGDRISRNQLLVLKHESYFDKVSNPSDGAYYIESLTDQLAHKALDVFKAIEQAGGFLKQLKDGVIQKKIKESAQKEQEQFNANDIVLLGTNKHPNPNDKMKQDLELHPFLEKKTRKTLIEPIIERRLSEAIELERLKHE
ncbi:methylmalonyl-CoA mutase subunit beta [Ichthyenterobacterium sp. W332]|uniref:Methylmalonyl-CoA mutase subunit beta n=1 Tax=Microcosmobacter mediterraneus TaxID=3075607 RepID=A0ABU2YGR8_9FLAO|nr:methylmalonyl-CoA mutase subunit beta [Ichthyenterobacterium sp. W332]MDT0557232.1 methylmalonyl-CoA mutase subunit beta [Ichthyenterobacterium sp. W332]